MNKKYILSLTLLFFSFATVFGQTRKQYMKAAENAFVQKNYYAAMKYYEEVIDFDSSAIEPWYKLGLSAQQFFAFSMAEEAFMRTCDSEESAKYPIAKLHLAEVQKGMGKYQEAIVSYQKALADTSFSNTVFRAKAEEGLEICEWAAEVVSSPDENIVIENLGTDINSPASETAPQKVGETLYYNSLRYQDPNDKHDPPRTYQRLLLAEGSGAGEVWEDFNVKKGHVGNAVFRENGMTRVYYTICDYVSDAETRCDIYYRDRNAETKEWGTPQKLPGTINTPGFTTTQPEIAKIGEEYWLLFASDKPGGKGGMDMYYSVMDEENGIFSVPMNFGDLNTEGDDITPFYHEGTSTLYFSANSRQGLGGHDIFKSVKTGDSWSVPEHMGYPLNSSLDDIHFKPSEGGAYAYLASNRLGSTFIEKEKEACCHDIYIMQTQQAELLVTTFNKTTKEPLPGVTVTLSRLKGADPVVTTNEEGNDFAFKPERRYAYLLVAEKEGFSTEKDTVYLDRAPEDDMLVVSREFYLEQNEVELTVLTFDAYTKEGLVGTAVQLFELVGGERRLVKKEVNENGNDFIFKILPGKTYVVRGSKNGYEHDLKTIEVPPLADLKSNKIQEDLFLAPLIFAEFLPISLYFDNDEPDKKTKSVTTKKTYLETWDRYIARKGDFLQEFGKGMEGQIKELATQRLEGFFQKEVGKGGENLKTFSDLLYEFLNQGNNIELILRGYTSPRAASEYNDKLSKRRIVSVKNHFEQYRGGIFKQYLDSGSLVITEKPYGESQSKSDVSDDIQDVRNSIYGVPASYERRVEIIDVKQAEDTPAGTR